MISSIVYDQSAALASEDPQRINQSGAYVGVIDQADMFDTKNGATMARFRFTVTTTGQVCWMTLCLRTSSGDTPFTFGIFQSLMSILGLTTVTPKQAKIKNPKGEVVMGYRMDELMRKPIGFVLQVEPREYVNKGGEVKISTDMTIRRVFRASDKKTAKEILKNLEASQVEADLKYIAEHPKEVRKLSGQPASSEPPAAAYAADATQAAPSPAAEPDDVPF